MAIQNINDFSKSGELVIEFLTKINEILLEMKPSRLFPNIEFDYKKKEIIINQKIISLKNNIYLISFGKAAFSMTEALLSNLKSFDSFRIKKGIIIGLKEEKNPNFMYNDFNINVFFGTHPDISKENFKATQEVITLVKKLNEDDILISLISGGGSALFEYPYSGVDLDETIKLNKKLITCGASIEEMNYVRKAFSSIKGGKLYSICKGRMLNFILSDVPSNKLSTIASGPTFPEMIDLNLIKKIINEYGLNNYISDETLAIVEKKINEFNIKFKESEKDLNKKENNSFLLGGSKILNEIVNKIISNNWFKILISSIFMNSSTDDIVDDLLKILLEKKEKAADDKKIIIIGTGETTVKIYSDIKGVGGRNQHLVATLALKLIEHEKKLNLRNWVILSFATDGIDGNSPFAGAILDKELFNTNKNYQKELKKDIIEFNTSNFFMNTKRAIKTGRTGTNCADLFIGYFQFWSYFSRLCSK